MINQSAHPVFLPGNKGTKSGICNTFARTRYDFPPI